MKLFPASYSSYLMYNFWYLGDKKIQFRTLGKWREHVWEDRWREHITAMRTGGHGLLLCFKEFLVWTNKHYCMNTNKMLPRPCRNWRVGLADRQRHSAIAQNVFCQLLMKVWIWRTKNSLRVRIYNVWKSELYESQTSKSQGPHMFLKLKSCALLFWLLQLKEFQNVHLTAGS